MACFEGTTPPISRDAVPIVFDNGTSMTKVGIAPLKGEPELVQDGRFPTIYGEPKEKAATEGVANEKDIRVGWAAEVSYHKVPSNYTHSYSPFI